MPKTKFTCTCDYCGKTYNRLYDLRNHIIRRDCQKKVVKKRIRKKVGVRKGAVRRPKVYIKHIDVPEI